MPKKNEAKASEEEVDEAELPEEQEAPETKKPAQPEPEITIGFKDDAVKHLLDLVANIGCKEITCHYGSGLTVREIDPSRVAMVVASIALGQQELDGEQVKRSFTVNVESLRNALKLREPVMTVGQTDILVRGKIGYTEKEADVSIPLLETEDMDIPEPAISHFDVESSIDFDDIHKALKVLSESVEWLRFDAEDGKLTIRGVGNLQKINIEGFKAEGEGKASYSYSYLEALKDTWKVQYSKDIPMKATRQETDGYGDDKRVVANIAFWIAPRIEVD